MNRTILISLAVFASAVGFAVGAQAAEQNCCEKKAGESAAASCCSKSAAADAHTSHGVAAEAPISGHEDHAAQERPPQSGHGRMGGNTGGRGGQGGGGMRTVMPDAMRLLHNYAALTRTTHEIPNGVRTVTTTSDPALLELLRRHPREMYHFYESGGVVRPHDPMFRELSRVADKVAMEFKDIEDGIEVTTTSDDAEVVKLIRAHGAKVDDFVRRGHAALHAGAPLPEDYQPSE